MENMTKVPGTDRGFPADDYYSFQRFGDPGVTLSHDSNTMRLNNTGNMELVVTAINVSDDNKFNYIIKDSQQAVVGLPITIPPGSYADLDITFVVNNAVKELFKESITIVSNADNAFENSATLHGAFMTSPANDREIDAQQIMDVFGFQTSILSVVNDQGTINPLNPTPIYPRGSFPKEANVLAGYEGDLILAPAFVQADPKKPVITFQLAAFHDGPVGHGARFQELDGEDIVGGINYFHSPDWYQTILPERANIISADQSDLINEPFEIVIQRYPSTGGNNFAGNRPDVLGTRIYKVRDHNGNVIPNEYIGIQDFVGGGCTSTGSSNCDFQDNVHYFINIRPSGVPSALPVPDIVKNTEETFSVDLKNYFDLGYSGNSFTYSGTDISGNNLPNWMGLNSITGEFSGITPENPGSFTVFFDGLDPNGFTASTSLNISVLEDGATIVAKSIKQFIPLNNLTLYPNPASVSTTLGFDMPTQVESIQIFDVAGRLVKTIKGGLVDRNGTPIDVQELPTGTYYVNTKDSLGQEFKQQMLITRQ